MLRSYGFLNCILATLVEGTLDVLPDLAHHLVIRVVTAEDVMVIWRAIET